MKRIGWILMVLALASLACASLSGGSDVNPAPNAGADVNNAPGDESSADDPADDVSPSDDGPSPAIDWACYNPFYPLGEGGVYTYQASYADPTGTGETVVSEYEIETLEQTDESLTLEMRFAESSSEVTWLCDEGGMFSNGFAQFNFQFMDDIEIETVSYEGVSLPKEADWYIGGTWDTDYEINMSYAIEGMAVTSHVVGEMDNEITGIEPVTVPAGTYPEAYVVRTTGQLTISINLMGIDNTSNAPLDMTSWYVKGVGMVKQISTDDYGTSLTELTSME